AVVSGGVGILGQSVEGGGLVEGDQAGIEGLGLGALEDGHGVLEVLGVVRPNALVKQIAAGRRPQEEQGQANKPAGCKILSHGTSSTVGRRPRGEGVAGSTRLRLGRGRNPRRVANVRRPKAGLKNTAYCCW